jgi:hypothetical protein
MNDEEPLPEPILFNGTLPGAVGNVASILGAADIATHKQRAIDIHTFFMEENKEMLQLNMDHTTCTFIVGLPNSSKVRVLHCIGVGATAIGQMPSAIDGKLLFFHGDGGQDIGTPLPLVLPQSVLTPHEVLSMTQAQFHATLTEKGPTYTWPLVPRIRAFEANSKHTVMQIAPIPAFLVLDGIHQDLDAADVLERVLSLDNHNGDMFAHIKCFLLACLTGHNVGDASPQLSQAVLFNPPAADARQWATAKFRDSYPTLVEPPQAAPADNALLAGNPDMAALIAQLLADRTGAPATGEEKKDDDDTSSKKPLGMSNLELAATLKMCGLPNNADTDLLPAWFRQCLEKGMTATYQCMVVCNHISKHYRYEDAEVPITNNILKMAIKRNWMGKEGNVSAPSFTNSNEGLSPFLMVDLTEDEVAQVNDEDKALTTASNVTMGEIKAAKHKLKSAVPDSAEKFIHMLLCYANLLYALFGGDCPLFQSIVQIITAFKSYSRNARENFSKLTKASILWVILKQSHQFSIGEMDILGKLKTMYEHLNGKLCSYHHAETPKILYEADTSKKRKPNNDTNDKDPKIIKKDNPNTWHPKLTEALGEQMKKTNNPMFSAIMKYCGTNASDVYHIYSKKCAPNAFFGRCTKGKECTKDHSPPKLTDVEKILELTKKFREDPSGITRG